MDMISTIETICGRFRRLFARPGDARRSATGGIECLVQKLKANIKQKRPAGSFQPLPRYTIQDYEKTRWGRFDQRLVDWLHRNGD